MKIRSILLSAICVAALSTTLFSCNDDDATDLSAQSTRIDSKAFEQLGLVHTYTTPLEVLDFEASDFQALYLSLTDQLELGETQVQFPTIDQINDVTSRIEEKYPDLYTLAEKDYQMIKVNFPTLTQADIEAKFEIIKAYYDLNMQYEIITQLAEIFSPSTNGMATYGFKKDYSLSLAKAQFWFLMANPCVILAVKKATVLAEKYTLVYYGNLSSQGPSDAFKHICWNTLIAKYTAEKIKNIDKAILVAKEFTDRYEKANIGHTPAYDQQMDYHNNFIGRDYFQSVATIEKKWIIKYLNCPTDKVLTDEIKNKVDHGVRVQKTVEAVHAVAATTPVYF